VSVNGNKTGIDFRGTCKATPQVSIDAPTSGVVGQTFNVVVTLKNTNFAVGSDVPVYLDLSFPESESQNLTIGNASGSGWSGGPKLYRPGKPFPDNEVWHAPDGSHPDWYKINALYALVSAERFGIGFNQSYSFAVPVTPTQSGTIQLYYRGTIGDQRHPSSSSSQDQQGLYVNVKSMTVQEPDLIVQPVTASKTNPVVNEGITITAVVKNQGNAAISGSFRVDLYKNLSFPPTAPSSGDASQTISSLGVGETKTLTFNNISYSSEGSYKLWILADSQNNINEGSNEGNNYGPSSGLMISVPPPVARVDGHIYDAKTKQPEVGLKVNLYLRELYVPGKTDTTDQNGYFQLSFISSNEVGGGSYSPGVLEVEEKDGNVVVQTSAYYSIEDFNNSRALHLDIYIYWDRKWDHLSPSGRPRTLNQFYILEGPDRNGDGHWEDEIQSKEPPLLLVHGLGGESGYWGYIPRKLLSAYQIQTWQIYYPNDNWIKESAAVLKDALNEILRYYPNKKIDIVAHSMGGLVTRAYIANMASYPYGQDRVYPYEGNIRKFLMLGTPNFGSHRANEILEKSPSCEDLVVTWLTGGDTNAEALQDLAAGSKFIWDINAKSLVGNVENLLVVAGTKPIPFSGICGKEAENQEDGIVAVSSASLLPFFPLATMQLDHVELKTDPSIVNIINGFRLATNDEDMKRRISPYVDKYIPPDTQGFKEGALILKYFDEFGKETSADITLTGLTTPYVSNILQENSNGDFNTPIYFHSHGHLVRHIPLKSLKHRVEVRISSMFIKGGMMGMLGNTRSLLPPT